MSKSPKASPSKIASLLTPETIKLELQANQKVAALREVAELLAQNRCVSDFEAFFNEILQRERVSNTALGHDVAIPHARTDQCSDILVAVGRTREGIDFEAKDGQPVRLIFLIGTPRQMVTDYLRVVGNLARLLRQDDLRQRLLDAPDPAAFIKIIEDAEG
ncbi:MAG TPA: PTS sugar transporter subunit IIA [Verrucomicrobiae bacterium]|nr:PTS sugar transporter subunit IIA [Verrucomicrobiae bacterium]